MSGTPATTVDLDGERAALDRARDAVQAKLRTLDTISGGGADALADEYIDAVVRGAIEKLQQELVVFGRIDDDQPWRVGLYGIDQDEVATWARLEALTGEVALVEPSISTQPVRRPGSPSDLAV